MASQHRPALRPRGGGRWPADVACGPAFFGPLVVCMLFGSWAPAPLELAVLTAIVAAIGWAAAAPAGLVVIGASLLSFNAFHENGLGVLAVHPAVDGPVAVLLVTAWLLSRVA
jgi:hypothetical protein